MSPSLASRTITDILSMAPWWFWVFVFPEALSFVLFVTFWLCVGVAIVVSYPFNRTRWR